MKQITVALIMFCWLASSCKETINNKDSETDTNTTQNRDTTAAATADNSNNVLDWAGTYNGITPCADCDGIETSLQLNRDNTYKLTTKYLGKPDTTQQQTEGRFNWDKSGSIITLQGLKNTPTQYKVGEDILMQYDLQGKEITGALANRYILQKTI